MNPDLRFNDENGEKYPDWEEKSLNTISIIKKGQQLGKMEMVPNGKYYVLNGGILPSGYTNDYNVNENIISISEGGNSCGYIKYNKEKFWSGGHNYTLDNVKENKGYLYQVLKSKQNEVMSLRVGSGIPNIQKSRLDNFIISIPYLEEQKKIATLLSDIDDKIEKQSEIVRKLKETKEAMLVKMFPKEDSLVPEIRFDGFSGDWEEKILGEICTKITDGAHNSPKEVSKGIHMPSVKDMTHNGFDFSSCKQISKKDFNILKKQGCSPEKDDILISKDGTILTYCFVVKENKIDYVILSSIAIIRPNKKKFNSNFLSQYFKINSFINNTIEQYSKGNALKRIVLKDFKQMKIFIPNSIKEQEKIGEYFSNLDELIELQSIKLSKLQDTKKALLHKLLP